RAESGSRLAALPPQRSQPWSEWRRARCPRCFQNAACRSRSYKYFKAPAVFNPPTLVTLVSDACQGTRLPAIWLSPENPFEHLSRSFLVPPSESVNERVHQTYAYKSGYPDPKFHVAHGR